MSASCSQDGPRVIEFNCRLGDPEAQVILPRLKSDLVAAMMAAIEGGLGHLTLRWDEGSAVTVVMASNGYPNAYEKGSAIEGARNVDAMEDTLVFHAGTQIDDNGQLRAAGGRVLAITGLGENVNAAREAAYRGVNAINWPEGFFRRDIAAA